MKLDSSPAANLLLLDSDSFTRSVLRDTLETGGYLVVPAGDLGEAIDRLNEMRPDLLITRQYINSMSGYMAAEYLRGKHPGLPVLILGGFIDDDRTDVRNALADFHTFPKPFSREDLLGNIRDVLHTIRQKT